MSVSIDKNMSVSVQKRTSGTIEHFYPGWILYRYEKKYTIKDNIVCYVTYSKINFDIATKDTIEALESQGFKMEEFEPPFSKDRTPIQDDYIVPLWNKLIKKADKLCCV